MLLNDPTLSKAVERHGDELYSVCDNVRGFAAYLTNSGILNEDELFEGIDRKHFNDDNSWYKFRDYCHIMSNTVRYQKRLVTHEEYDDIGQYVLRHQGSFWYRYLSLLPLEAVFREATKVSHRIQNAYHIQLHRATVGEVDFLLQDTSAFAELSFGSECRYMTGVFKSLLALNGIRKCSVRHSVCGKSLRNLIQRQYHTQKWKYLKDSEGIHLDSKLLAKPLYASAFHEQFPEIPMGDWKGPAFKIVEDFEWKGLLLFRKGDIYDAPCCLMQVKYEPVQVWHRIKQFLFQRTRQLEHSLEERETQIQFAREKLDQAQQALQESERKSRILQVYVRPSLRTLVDNGQDPLLLEAREVDLAILFNDIIGFTSISESLTPTQVVELLNKHFSNACSIIYRHGGEVDKIMGDSVLGLFDDPDQAVLASLDMEQSMRVHKTLIREKYGVELKAGTGIHFGRVIAGNVGSMHKLDYTIIGDPVNSASRIQHLTRKYGTWFLCSDDLRRMLKRPQEMNCVGEEILRGRSQPTSFWTFSA